jgi:predicted nucleotidyltransferase component of viral defense system
VDGRIAAEYFRLYALEGLLLRLSHSTHRDRFVLKGGVLLAAYQLRRPTTDIDFAALATSNDLEDIRQTVIEIARTPLPPELDDGLVFDLGAVTAQVIRDQDQYSGVRVRLGARLVTARETFHVDVNVGDPIWPAPADVELPRLLDQPAISLRGYPMEMVLAEKIVTALHLGIASTRWRDYGDIYQLTGRYDFNAGPVRDALAAVAAHRDVELTALTDELDGYAELAQTKWFAWRSRQDLVDRLPASFTEVLTAVTGFADPALSPTDEVGSARWSPQTRSWVDV